MAVIIDRSCPIRNGKVRAVFCACLCREFRPKTVVYAVWLDFEYLQMMHRAGGVPSGDEVRYAAILLPDEGV